MKIKKLLCMIMTGTMLLTMTGCGGNVENFNEYVTEVEEMQVPEETEIVALGEASHGNAEFQELKLDVLKVLVEQRKVQSFSLEGDFGGCQRVNEYIHGADMTAEEAVADIGFQLYRTEQMVALAKWMREYNETADEAEQLSFYGFDMQRYEHGAEIATDYCNQKGIDPSPVTEIFGESETEYSYDEKVKLLEQLEKEVLESGEDEQTKIAARCIACLIQNVQMGHLDETNPGGYNKLRDSLMAENVNWIVSHEKEKGNDCVMISGHNGHVAKKGNSYTNTGSILAEQYGEAYFVIGTDFYETECNLPVNDGRENHKFVSNDPLAKKTGEAGLKKAYLDFEKAMENDELASVLKKPMSMGSLGEFYGWYMNFLPKTYRIKMKPVQLYDAMIFVTNATPTEIYELEDTE